jgi:hypothetical protein
MLHLTFKRQVFVYFFKSFKYLNRNFSEAGTGIAINHYGSTTLEIRGAGQIFEALPNGEL